MDNTKNLDDYLAGLGISESDEAVLPALPHSGSPGGAVATGDGPATTAPSPGGPSPQETLQQFLSGLLGRIDPELQLTLRQGDGALEADIQGTQAARLSGRDGRVLGAVEVLAYAALSRQGHNEVRVRIDAGGFRKRHAENLSRVAERLAVQVAKTGEPHEMQPMPPADRRVFHLALQDHPLVQTESVGEGTARRLIILPRTDPVKGTAVPGDPASDDDAAEA
ncbi:protein jag [Deinococcus sp.]|uniref:Jag family protein n=1 Tax=Deinococcus sp. TaxID=47478 RepID=UPI003C7CDD61